MVGFKRVEVTHIPKSENQMADALANLVTSSLHPYNVEVGVMDQPSIQSTTIMAIDEQVEQSWMVPITEYLVNGALPENRFKAVKVKARAVRYFLMNGVMYRRSFSRPYLRC